MISLIVAMTEERIIGRNNCLPWFLPEDLKLFRRRTLGHPIIMGRKTYESIGRPLPQRRNIVISRTLSEAPEGVELLSSPEEALSAVSGEDSFIIGGAQIYRQTLGWADRLYISRVKGRYAGETRFPEFSASEWTKIKSQEYTGFTLEVWTRRG